MAETSAGKKWEAQFNSDWTKAFPSPEGTILRLHDQVTGYKTTSQNPCDFICFAKSKLFLVECKEHKGTTINWKAIPQYERLLKFKDSKDVFAACVVYFSDFDCAYWVSIQDMEKMHKDDRKSIHVNMINDKSYNIINIPAVKKVKYITCDFGPVVEELIARNNINDN